MQSALRPLQVGDVVVVDAVDEALALNMPLPRVHLAGAAKANQLHLQQPLERKAVGVRVEGEHELAVPVQLLYLVQDQRQGCAEIPVADAEQSYHDDVVNLGQRSQEHVVGIGSGERSPHRPRPLGGRSSRGKPRGRAVRLELREQRCDGHALRQEPRQRPPDVDLGLPLRPAGVQRRLHVPVELGHEGPAQPARGGQPEPGQQAGDELLEGLGRERERLAHREARLDPLLKQARDVHLLRHPHDAYAHVGLLGDVEEVVQQRLPRPGAEVLEPVEDDDCGARLLEALLHDGAEPLQALLEARVPVGELEALLRHLRGQVAHALGVGAVGAAVRAQHHGRGGALLLSQPLQALLHRVALAGARVAQDQHRPALPAPSAAQTSPHDGEYLVAEARRRVLAQVRVLEVRADDLLRLSDELAVL
mmetsp:Transcript_68496/g.178358  ORF Transcript_68496/g.178358 Transcript_68496/m.178358 type:complete len:421 (-) Transcript_68496:120-1382(-)